MRQLGYCLVFAALFAALVFPVFAGKVDIPTVNGIPGIFFTDENLLQVYPVSTGTPFPVELWGSSSVNLPSSITAILDSAGSRGTVDFVADSSGGSFTAGANAKDQALGNNGTETMWLSFDGPATVSMGIPLFPGEVKSWDAKAGHVVNYVASTPTAGAYVEGQK